MLTVVSFIMLLLIPGFITIGLLKLRNLNWLDGILYAVGISVLFDIIVGVAINFILPVFGVDKPLSFASVVLTWTFIAVICLVIIGIFRKKLLEPYEFKFSRWSFAPIGIYIFSVFLIYLMTLPTSNLLGSDVHLEYYHANQTLINGYWNYSAFDPINLCLPITILLPIYSLLMNIDMFTVLKVVQPLVMGLLPLVLYRIYRIQFGRVIAILTTVFFVTLPTYNMDLVQLVRQQYAILFFALVVLLFVGSRIGIYSKVFLSVMFSVGVIVSHYGLGVGFSGYIFFSVVFIALLRLRYIKSAWMWLVRVKTGLPKNMTSQLKYQLITLICLSLLCISFIWGYYSFVASGAGMSAVGVVQQIATSTVSDIKNIGDNTNVSIRLSEPLLYTAVGLDFGGASVLGKVWRIILYIFEACFIIGVLRLLLRPASIGEIRGIFFAFIIASGAIILGMYVLRTAAYGMGASRIFGIALVFASPLFIYGIDSIVKFFSRAKWRQSYTVIATSCMLVPFFLFNSGVVFEITKSPNLSTIDIPYSIALSSYRLDITSRFEQEDIEAAQWVKENLKDDYIVYGDCHGAQLLYQIFGYYDGRVKYLYDVGRESNGFMFLRKHNVDTMTLTWGSSYGCRKSIPWEGSEFIYWVRDNPIVYNDGAMIILIGEDK